MPRDPFSNVQDRAAWAERFKNATTNAAQRTRYREDIAAGDRDEDMADAAAFEDAQLADPELGRLMLGRARENRQRFEGELNRDFRERQLQFQQGRAARQDMLNQQKFSLDLEKADLAERKAMREMKDAARIERETDALEQASFDLREAGMLPGSEGYAAGMAAAAIANPYARPDLRATIFKDAKIDHDPDEFLAEAQRLGVTNPRLSIRQGADGRKLYGVTAGPEPKEETAGMIFNSMDELRSAFPQGGVRFDLLPDGKIKAEGGTVTRPKEQGIAGALMGQPQPSSPATKVPVPEVGMIKGGFKFKGGNPGDKNSWEPVQ